MPARNGFCKACGTTNPHDSIEDCKEYLRGLARHASWDFAINNLGEMEQERVVAVMLSRQALLTEAEHAKSSL